MIKVFAAKKGAEIRVDNYGVATEFDPILVPSEVAKELIALPEFTATGKVRPVPPPEPVEEPKAAPKTADTKPDSGKKE